MLVFEIFQHRLSGLSLKHSTEHVSSFLESQTVKFLVSYSMAGAFLRVMLIAFIAFAVSSAFVFRTRAVLSSNNVVNPSTQYYLSVFKKRKMGSLYSKEVLMFRGGDANIVRQKINNLLNF
jgi:hypothetical protein